MGSRVKSTSPNRRYLIFYKMKSFLLLSLAGATFASEIALDTPEQFIKDKKHAKYSQSVPSEDLKETLAQVPGAFSLSADAEPCASCEADADAWYGYYGHGLHRPYGYGYYGYRPYGYGYYYGKRSAEAEPEAAPTADAAASPDADAWYGYYGRPYAYGYGYRPYGYGYYYGKRSAEAEPAAEASASPEADADPWYGYYGYGLHRPYGYGYYGYR